jgi:hypothetical protein
LLCVCVAFTGWIYTLKDELERLFLLSERGKDCHSFVIDFDCIDYSDEWCAKEEFRKKDSRAERFVGARV